MSHISKLIIVMLFSGMLIFLLGACSDSEVNDRAAQTGDTVSVHYTGTLSDGSQFDTSRERGPRSFVLGGGQMIAGFDAAVQGMKTGEKKTVVIPPDQAYGEHDPDKIVTIDRSQFAEGSQLYVGLQVSLRANNGQTVPGVITEVKPGYVKVDLNHKLAGKELTFEIEMVSITPASETE